MVEKILDILIKIGKTISIIIPFLEGIKQIWNLKKSKENKN